MHLIGAIQDAARHADRVEYFARRSVDVIEEDEATTPERARARLESLPSRDEMLVRWRASDDAIDFLSASGQQAHEHPARFAVFLFKKRCPAYAGGLLSDDAFAALESAMSAARRGRGRPRNDPKNRGRRVRTKEEEYATLFAAAGLQRISPDHIQKDWLAWKESFPGHEWSPPK